MRVTIFLLLGLILSFPAYAQCTDPPAEMGVLIMNKKHKVMQYCNGDDWIGLWGGGNSESGDTTPAGAVMAFDLSDCPEGWSPYAPSSGRFLRGRCISGEMCNDPDGMRMAGNAQGDALGSHTHTGTAASAGEHTHTGTTSSAGAHTHSYSTPTQNWAGAGHASGFAAVFANRNTDSAGAHTHSFTTGSAGAHTHALTINAAGAAENRPKNVAVLYCRKD